MDLGPWRCQSILNALLLSLISQVAACHPGKTPTNAPRAAEPSPSPALAAKGAPRTTAEFLAAVSLPLIGGGSFDSARRYLAPTNYIGHQAWVQRCRSMRTLSDSVGSGMRRARFHHDYELPQITVVPRDLAECATFVRDTPKQEYARAHPGLPANERDASLVRDVVRICLQVDAEMDLCRLEAAVHAARWMERSSSRVELIDVHKDALIEEALRLLQEILGTP